MKRFLFKKGLIFNDFTNRWQLIRRLVTGKLQFESDSGEIINLTDKETLGKWQNGDWQVDEANLDLDGDVIYLATPADLSTYPLKWQLIAQRRLHYIQAVNPEFNKYNVEFWKSIIEKVAPDISDNNPPSPLTVQLWWKRYRINKSINALLPHTVKGKSKKEDARHLIFLELINKFYLNMQKVPALDVVQKLQQRISILNTARELSDKIKTVSQSTVYRWINELRADIRETSRLGADVTRNKYRTVMGGLKQSAILERVEIDHTPLDLITIDQHTNLPLGRAYLTCAIDKYSRMITGFYISYNAPSSYAVMQCIKQMILTKDRLLKRFSDIKNDWPAFGIPDLLALDNGMDLHAEALKKACLEMGIQILYCPAARPEMKGSIERYFRTINQGLIHKLPGSTFSNIVDRGDYESENTAAIDMETLVHLITKWIVDVYNVTPQRGIGDTPLNKWVESSKHKLIELPIYPTQLDVITGVPANRTVFHYGIELDGLHYNNKKLQELRKISGKNLRVDLKFYEDHVAYIDVFDPYEKEYLRVEAVHQDYVDGLHREAHRISRIQARKKFGELYSMPQLMDAKKEIEDIVTKALKAKKMAQRKKAANVLMHDSNAVFNDNNPLELAAKKPIKRSYIVPPEPLESGLEDDLPVLKRNLDNGNDEVSL